MSAKYRIKDSGDGQFSLIDDSGKEVGFLRHKRRGSAGPERAMKLHGVDRDTSRHWIRRAAEAADWTGCLIHCLDSKNLGC